MEAAGGITAWKRNRLINKILTPLDYLAIIIGIISIGGIALFLLFSVLSTAFRLLEKKLPNAWSESNENSVIIISVLLAIIWCYVRWKHLNKRPEPWDNEKV